jgi:hypothetical protein
MVNSIFPQVGVGKMPQNVYFAENIGTPTGGDNIQIKEKKPANILHLLIGVGIVIAVVVLASKGFENHGI